jgi:hypothetical protein
MTVTAGGHPKRLSVGQPTGIAGFVEISMTAGDFFSAEVDYDIVIHRCWSKNKSVP